MSHRSAHPVIWFDGQCNVCNGFVQYVIKRDPDARFRFAPLQSAEDHPEGPTFETMLLEQDGVTYRYSDAVLNTFAQLKGPARLLAIFRIIPKPLRDRIYRWIARRRYWIFGKTDQCMVPTPEIMDRFVKTAPTPEQDG
ncbi:MAG: DCC1-like thiol-disulfide oxidoreductase family protein [Saprospiraceae bacterium]|nr:DCC1-like thiol-disulfide oxidoreductase family protein [Saprospiraceae bacterium]